MLMVYFKLVLVLIEVLLMVLEVVMVKKLKYNLDMILMAFQCN